MAKYYLVTDTHGYPWGMTYDQAIDFDLGDNTPSTVDSLKEEVHNTGAEMVLIGNHDTVVMEPSEITNRMNTVEEYRAYKRADKDYEKGVFFGINNARGFNDYDITEAALTSLASKMENLPSGVNVAILSHIPLFKRTPDMGESYPVKEEGYNNWIHVNLLMDLLNAFNNQNANFSFLNHSYNLNNGGRVIGCFCGHVHNQIRCFYRGIFMESFGTNGAKEWKSSGHMGNPGLYQPTLKEININLTNHTVNTYNYIYHGSAAEAGTDNVVVGDGYSGKAYGNEAIGPYTLQNKVKNSSVFYPKFYHGAYLGYSTGIATPGVVTPNEACDGHYQLGGGVSISGLGTVKYLRFDAEGLLRYYSTNTNSDEDYHEIPNYKSADIQFVYDGTNWGFKNGLLAYQAKYVAGTINGKNGYSIEFDSDGYAKQMNLNGEKVNFSEGNNWINVYNLRVFWRPFTDHSNCDSTGNVPQIGITGTFGTHTRIDLGRSTTSGPNWISNRFNVLIRVVGENNKVSWLYDGRLTDLTDEELKI